MKRTFLLEPFDTLVFRDGQPFDQGDEGQARAHSIMPPLATTIVGAVRVAIASALGWQGGNWAGDHAIEAVVGSGSNLAGLQFRGPFIAGKDEQQKWQRLFPFPQGHQPSLGNGEWDAAVDGSGDITFAPAAFNELSAKSDLSSNQQQFFPREEGLLGFSGQNLWITERALFKILRESSAIEPKELFYDCPENCPRAFTFDKAIERSLWSVETHIGLARTPWGPEGRNPGARTALEGALYQLAHIRLHPDIAIGIDVTLPEGVTDSELNPANGMIVPLGGEGRAAFLSVSERLEGAFDNARGMGNVESIHIYLASPLNLEDSCKFKPDASWPIPGMDDTKLVLKSANSDQLELGGSWQGLANGSSRNECFVPAGSVLSFDVSKDNGKELPYAELYQNLDCLGVRTEWGFGYVFPFS